MSVPTRRRRFRVFVVAFMAGFVAGLAVLPVVLGPSLSIAPWWHVTVSSRPGFLVAGGKGEVAVRVSNLGDAAANGKTTPIAVTGTLPVGLKATAVEALVDGQHGAASCPSAVQVAGGAALACSLPGVLAPFSDIEMVIQVEVKTNAAVCEAGANACERVGVTVSGGDTLPVALTRPVTVSDAVVPFGLQDYEVGFEEEGGGVDTRAGSHPFQVTGTLVFNQVFQAGEQGSSVLPAPAALLRDAVVKLPTGFVGNPPSLPRCPLGQFLTRIQEASGETANECPAQTAIGVSSVLLDEPDIGLTSFIVPVFNVEPGFGEPARFGFYVPASETPVLLDASVRGGPGSGEEYAVSVSSNNTSQLVGLLSAETTFWGVPGDARHDSSRGWACLNGGASSCGTEDQHPPAFLTMPTSCTGQPLEGNIELDSWADPKPAGQRLTITPTLALSALDGCNQLAFSPTIEARPTTTAAASPSGLDFNLDFHDEGLTSAEGLAQSQLNKTVVTLPEGFTVNPSSGVGLAGCTPTDYANETLASEPGAGCPNESKLGEVTIETPLLTQKITGSIFIAQPYENPFPEPEAGHPDGTLLALYVVVKSPETGILIKLSGKVTPNPVTGRLTTTFENNPQLPFAHFNFHFREGARAPLITPPTCGTYETVAELSPWTEPAIALIDTSPFTITTGVGGSPCPAAGVPPFNPQIAAGTLNNNAGAFSPLDIHITRGDQDQEISSFSTLTPEGLTGDLTGIPFCPEADIAQARAKTGAQELASPSCPAQSLIGHSLVGTGAGAVLAYTPGSIYLAGPYNGAPFSLVSVTSAVVGPFDLGTVVIRFGLRIDPLTAQVSADPTSAEPIPTIIHGIVTHVRDIRVQIDRPNFILNPTSCEPAAIQSTLTGSQGATATISSRFQTANCANLKYQPTVKVTTAGKASKANGASLHFLIAYPKNAIGNQTWMKEMKFDIPKQLPARLTTIQKACLAHVFETERQNCPAASIIGHLIVHTPILPVPLEGPLYFVSYGGAKFPDAVAVIKGYGVTIESHGHTFINNKTGITSATFETIPDVPFETIDVTVPQGPYSEFGANLPHETYNFCGHKLTMPILLKAQNGQQIHQNIPITPTNCPKPKHHPHKHHPHKHHKK